MQNCGDDKAEETERGDTLPWKLAIVVFEHTIPGLHKAANVLEQSSKFAGARV